MNTSNTLNLSQLHLTATKPGTKLLTHKDPVIPDLSSTSLGRDALLPDPGALRFTMDTQPWSLTRDDWARIIRTENLIDVEAYFYRTLSEGSMCGFSLRPTDGAFRRHDTGRALAIQPRAWDQLCQLLLQNVPNRPRGAGSDAFAFLSPPVRARVFEELKERSRRGEGEDSPMFLRSHRDPRTGLQALRAVLSGRSSGAHLDDSAIIVALDRFLKPGTRSQVTRGLDETQGFAVLDDSTVGASASVTFANSETGAKSVQFGSACWLHGLDVMIRRVTTSTGETVEEKVRRDVQIASAHGATRRNHTLPRVNRTQEERAEIAQRRLSEDINKALDNARALLADWRKALENFPRGGVPTAPADRKISAAVFLDLIQETETVDGETVKALQAVLENNERLAELPFLSAAHVAAAFACVAAGAATMAEAHALQLTAGRWVKDGWK